MQYTKFSCKIDIKENYKFFYVKLHKLLYAYGQIFVSAILDARLSNFLGVNYPPPPPHAGGVGLSTSGGQVCITSRAVTKIYSGRKGVHKKRSS